MADSLVKSFSDGYLLLDVPTCQHSGKSVIVDHGFYDHLTKYSSRPLLRIGDEYYQPRAEWGVPPGTVALPENREGEPVLLAKEKLVARLIETDSRLTV